jgi:hypothetical protein
MTNVLQLGAQWLGDSLKQAAGRVVSVTDGANTVHGVTATLALAEYETLDDEAFPITVRSFDWVFEAADVEAVALRAGTRITDDTGAIYEVAPMSTRPAVEDNDTSGIMLLVHSKRVIIAPPPAIVQMKTVTLVDNPEGAIGVAYSGAVVAADFDPAAFSYQSTAGQFIFQNGANAIYVQATAWIGNLVIGQVLHYSGTTPGILSPDQGALT